MATSIRSVRPRSIDFIRGVLTLITLAGFAIRVYRLGAKSLWLDEGLSVNFAGRSLPDVLAVMAGQDIHPPLYYVLLHLWMQVAGISEFAVRFTALISGTLLIPATFVLALAVFGHRQTSTSDLTAIASGLIAALLVAVSPFLVSYSQEARMYSDVALWSVVSSYCLWRLIEAWQERQSRRGGWPWRWMLLYGSAVAGSIYTHYFAALVLAFHAVYILVCVLRNHRFLPPVLISAGIALLLYLPWSYGAYLQLRRLTNSPDFWQGELSLTFIVEKLFTAFALGKSGIPVQSLPIIIVAALVFGIGLLYLLRRGVSGHPGELFALLYLIIPLLLLYAISARNPKFTERYLIMITPVFYVIVARGIVALGASGRFVARKWPLARSVSIALAGLIVAGSVIGSGAELRRVYFGPGYEKDNNRDAIAYIEQHEQPGDVIVSMMDLDHVLRYYYHGKLERDGLHPSDDAASAAQLLNQYTTGHKRMWLLLWQEQWADPSGVARDMIDSQLTRLETHDLEYIGLKLQLYSIEPGVVFSAQPKPVRAADVNFGGLMRLTGYDPPRQAVQAGKQAQFTFYWQPLKTMTQDYVVSVRLADGAQRYARHDQRPAAYTYPTTAWRTDRPVFGRFPVDVPIGTPPGTYDVELVVYSQETKQDVVVLDSTGRSREPRAVIGQVMINRPSAAPDPASVPVPARLDFAFDGRIKLLGTDPMTPSARPGSKLDLGLYWQAMSDTMGDMRSVLSLVDSAGREFTLLDDRPLGDKYPTSRWIKGEIVLGQRPVVIPAEAAPGQARIYIQIRDGASAQRVGDAVQIGQISLAGRPALSGPPANIQHKTAFTVGDFAGFLGYEVDPQSVTAGNQVKLTLIWEARATPSIGYTVFTHLIDAQEKVVAQKDGVPDQGNNPTTGWLAGDYIRDEYVLSVPKDLPPGEYSLEIGMYDPATGQRARVSDETGAIGDRILPGKISVVK